MDLSGKLVVVTGANTGIGRVTAETLAKQGARVILATRSEAKTAPVVEAIRASGGTAEWLALDLADFASVRAAAERLLARDEAIPLVIANAGFAGLRGLTKDGFELTFGTNHLGHYLFVRLLLPAIERAPLPGGARIVIVSSKAHYDAKPIDWQAQREPTKAVTGLPEYAVSKLSNVLFAKELARRVPSHVHTYALHPGVVASDAWRSVPWGVRHLIKLFMITNEEGARTTLYCATSDEVASHTGRYYDTSREKKPSKLALDDALARTLWEKSAEWVGLPV
jgi:NAD(P)-dependent dehydrogenase (short-subunit alcohol dehydrogenase family)